MIFAAGFGTRMGDLTRKRPKPLIPVAGRALLDHALDVTNGAGLGRVVVNAHYHAEQIVAHLAPRDDVSVSLEQPDVLDTGGGLRQALPMLGATPVFTLNSDAVWTGSNPLAQLARAWDPARMDALLLLVPPARAKGHLGAGDFVIAPDGQLSRGAGWVYSGAQIIATDGIDAVAQPAFSLNLLWTEMAAKGRLFGIEHDGGWCDVGHPDGIKLAETLLQQDGQGDV